jgi:hypothetical protein
MMLSPADAAAAPGLCQKQRFGLRHLLQVNEQLASPEDLALAKKVRAVTTPDAYDKALADKKVADLFRRDVLFFGTR